MVVDDRAAVNGLVADERGVFDAAVDDKFAAVVVNRAALRRRDAVDERNAREDRLSDVVEARAVSGVGAGNRDFFAEEFSGVVNRAAVRRRRAEDFDVRQRQFAAERVVNRAAVFRRDGILNGNVRQRQVRGVVNRAAEVRRAVFEGQTEDGDRSASDRRDSRARSAGNDDVRARSVDRHRTIDRQFARQFDRLAVNRLGEGDRGTDRVAARRDRATEVFLPSERRSVGQGVFDVLRQLDRLRLLDAVRVDDRDFNGNLAVGVGRDRARRDSESGVFSQDERFAFGENVVHLHSDRTVNADVGDRFAERRFAVVRVNDVLLGRNDEARTFANREVRFEDVVRFVEFDDRVAGVDRQGQFVLTGFVSRAEVPKFDECFAGREPIFDVEVAGLVAEDASQNRFGSFDRVSVGVEANRLQFDRERLEAVGVPRVAVTDREGNVPTFDEIARVGEAFAAETGERQGEARDRFLLAVQERAVFFEEAEIRSGDRLEFERAHIDRVNRSVLFDADNSVGAGSVGGQRGTVGRRRQRVRTGVERRGNGGRATFGVEGRIDRVFGRSVEGTGSGVEVERSVAAIVRDAD